MQPSDTDIAAALSTKLEEDFVAPLTAIRGALEILRDFSDLDSAERGKFVDTALAECARLERGVDHLAETVYDAGRRAHAADPAPATDARFAERIHLLDELDTIEVDFSDFVFDSSDTVNAFFTAIEDTLAGAGRDCFFLANYTDVRIWPEAWVAFAHRGKKITVGLSLGTVRYTLGEGAGPGSADADMYHSREEALAAIEDLRDRKS